MVIAEVLLARASGWLAVGALFSAVAHPVKESAKTLPSSRRFVIKASTNPETLAGPEIGHALEAGALALPWATIAAHNAAWLFSCAPYSVDLVVLVFSSVHALHDNGIP